MTLGGDRSPLRSRLLRRLATSTLSGDEVDERAMAQATLTLGTGVISLLATMWVLAYALLGRGWSAAIPFAYQAVSVVVLVSLRRRWLGLRWARAIELAAMLVLPFALHATLGGFTGSAAVAMWALCTPLLAFLYGARPGGWMAGFVLLTVLAGLTESLWSRVGSQLPEGVVVPFYVLNLTGLGVAMYLGILYATAERERRRRDLAEASLLIDSERKRADALLESIMPAEVSRRLKAGEAKIADRVDHATVLIADIVGFTPLAERLTADQLVEVVDAVWTRFDRMAKERGLEKIKAVGDSYLVVGGLDPAVGDQTLETVDMALAMCRSDPSPDIGQIQVRVGVACGPVVAGVIGSMRPSFGLWGDTVNTASRMESTGVPGRVQVTEAVASCVDDRFSLEPRGTVDVKGKGPMHTYLVVDPITPGSPSPGQPVPPPAGTRLPAS